MTSDDEPGGRPEPPARRHKHRRAGVLIGVLTALLGFAIAVQVHANSGSDSLANLRESDLIGILDNQNARAERLRDQISQLQQTLRELQGSGDRAAAARKQAEQQEQDLAILLGLIPATGPGVRTRVDDPNGKLHAEDLLAVVEELRGAGAEAIQFGPVRVSTTTAITDSSGGISVDGVTVRAPYTLLAIGDAKTLDTALNIPGGVAASIRAAGGAVSVTESARIDITAVRPLPVPKYATPSGH